MTTSPSSSAQSPLLFPVGALPTVQPQETLPSGLYKRARELLSETRANVAAGLAKKGPNARLPRIDSWLLRHQETLTGAAGGLAAAGALCAGLGSKHDPAWFTAVLMGVAAAGFITAIYVSHAAQRLEDRGYRNRSTNLDARDVEKMLRAFNRKDPEAAVLIGPAVAELLRPVQYNLTSEGHALVRRLRESVASLPTDRAGPAARAARVFTIGIELLWGAPARGALQRLRPIFAEATPLERGELAGALEEMLRPDLLWSHEDIIAALPELISSKRGRSVD